MIGACSSTSKIEIDRGKLEELNAESVAWIVAEKEDLVSKSGACLKDKDPEEERLRLEASVPDKDQVTDSLAE